MSYVGYLCMLKNDILLVKLNVKFLALPQQLLNLRS